MKNLPCVIVLFWVIACGIFFTPWYKEYYYLLNLIDTLLVYGCLLHYFFKSSYYSEYQTKCVKTIVVVCFYQAFQYIIPAGLYFVGYLILLSLLIIHNIMGDFFKQRHWLHFLTALTLGYVCLGKSNFEGYDIFNCAGIGVCVGIFIGIVAGLWEWSQAYYVSQNYPLAETDGWDSADIIWSFVGGITGACFGALLQVDAIWWTALAVFVSCIGSEVLRILKVTK